MWTQTTFVRGNETSGCVAVEMIRRGGGRTPPFILVGLVVVLLILGFNYWTLSSQNADLQQDLEKLQTEVKISVVKQDQSEKKNKALHDTVHEMEGISGKLKKKLQEEDDLVKTKDQDNQKKAYEISSLKIQIVHLQEQIGGLTQQVEEREVEVAKVKETNGHLVSQRDDAVEAIAEKDTQINTLRRQLEQEKTHSNTQHYSLQDLRKKLTQSIGDLSKCQDRVSELKAKQRGDETKEKARIGILRSNEDNLNAKLASARAELTECQGNVSRVRASGLVQLQTDQMEEKLTAQKREAMAANPQKLVPGPFNLPGVEQKEVYQGPGQLGYVKGRAVQTRDSGMRGIIYHREIPILPRDPPSARRARPRFSVADMAREPAAGLSGLDDGKEVAAQPPLPPDDPNHPQLQPPGRAMLPIAWPPPLPGLARPRYNQVHPQPLAIPEQGPAVMERPAPPLAPDSNHHPLQPPNNNPNQQQQQQQEVLAPPPQLPPHQDTSLVNVQSEAYKHEQGNQALLTHRAEQEGNEGRLLVVSKQMLQREETQLEVGTGGDEGEQKPLLNTHGETEDKNHAQEQIDEPEAVNPKPDDHNHAGEQVDDSPALVPNPLSALHQLQQPVQLHHHQPLLPHLPPQAPIV